MNSTNLIKGKDLNLYILSGATSATGWTVLAFATSCSLEVNNDELDVASKFSCRWDAKLAGTANYTISADALYTQAATGGSYTGFDKLMTAMLDGDNVKWAIGAPVAETGACENKTFALDTAKLYYTGTAMISSLSLNANNGEIASCSISLAGDGELERKNDSGY